MGPKNFLPIRRPGCGLADRGKVPNRTVESPCPRASVAQRAREEAPGSGLPGPDLSSAISRNLGSPAGGQPSPFAQQRWGGAAPPAHPTDPRGCGAQAPPALLSHVAARDGFSVAPCPLTANPKAGDHNNARGGVGEGRKHAVTGSTGWGLGKLRGTDPTLPGRPSS